MKSAKEHVYEFIQQKIYTDKQFQDGIETKVIAELLEMQRSNVSAYVNELVKEGKLIKTNTRPVLYKLPVQNTLYTEKSCFTNLVGYNGSLRNAIQLAKAAILYPNSSLHVLLLSQPGCGTSRFASTMYQFAIEHAVWNSDSPYIEINCHHYVKNIEALNDEFFGINGALETTCFYRARKGMLFIDGFDLLNVHQQNKVFVFLETGKVYSDDNMMIAECHDTMIVLSASKQNAQQFQQRIPVTIELPILQERPLNERFKLINYFFSVEAENSKRSIKVTAEAIKALLSSEFTYHIKELEMEIKSACANAYVRVVTDYKKEIFVGLNDFKPQIKKNLLKVKHKSDIYNELLEEAEYIVYDQHKGYQKDTDKSAEDMYNIIKKQYDELSNRGIHPSSIENVINTHIRNLFNRYSYHNREDDRSNLEQLSKLVDKKVIEIVQNWLFTCQKEMGREFKSNVFYGLCLHINSLLTMEHSDRRVSDKQIALTIQEYPKEYAASVQFGMELKKAFNLDLPIEETILITMFLIEPEESGDEDYPVLLYVMHGNGAARALMEVTNSLTHCQNAYCYDMGLEKNSKEALEELRDLIVRIDNGKGIIVIYDMGSIKTMIETISEETNIKLRCINIPITLIGIDVARKCSMEKDIDYVYHKASLEINNLQQMERKQDNSVIITLCHTGEGGATQLKNYIDQYSKLNMKTIALSISDREELLHEVIALKKNYDIHAFVGTYDPKLFGIPFISITKIFENKKEDLDRILMFQSIRQSTCDYSATYQFLEEQFTFVSISKIKTTMPDLVDEIGDIYRLNDDERLGLFMHLACLMERLVAGENVQKNKDKERLISAFEEDYHFLGKKLKTLEKIFKVIIDDNEIATIIMMIKKI